MSIEGVDQESDVKDQPGDDFQTRDRLPGFVRPELVEKGLQVSAHGSLILGPGFGGGRLRTCGRGGRRKTSQKTKVRISDCADGGLGGKLKALCNSRRCRCRVAGIVRFAQNDRQKRVGSLFEVWLAP